MEDEKTSDKEGSKYDLILKIGIPVVLLAWLGVSAVVYFLFQDGEALSPGSAGDMFGAVNALFSALAFAFLIYTALMQREELKLQREELRETRKELARSAEAHQELVQITSYQTRLSEQSRRVDVMPTVKTYLTRNQDDYYVTFRFSYNPVYIVGWSLKPERDVTIDPKSTLKLQEPDFELNWHFGAIIRTKLEGLTLSVTFADIDHRKYSVHANIENLKIENEDPVFEGKWEPSDLS